MSRDSIQKFLLEESNVRGVLVHMDKTFQTILAQHEYPAPVRKHLADVLLAAALLSARIKLKGRLTIQFSSEGAIKMLVAQINDEGHVRGLAQWQGDADERELSLGLAEGRLVITIFQDGFENPLQSIVPIEGKTVAEALAFYFLQSEQLPTSFYFANDHEQAVGMLLQQMPEMDGKDREDQWRALMEQMMVFDTTAMLYSDNAPLLQMEFKKETIRVFEPKAIQFKCTCSTAKMENAVRMLGEQEASAVLQDKSEIVVTCEYCNAEYAFDKASVEHIFKTHFPQR